jgi:hypothetical protein
MMMRYQPTRPLHRRYQVEHGFLSAAAGWQVTTFGLTVGAFFGWEFNSFEVLVRGTDTIPIDFANATPDMALISLHYYFPWAIAALAKWCLYTVVTGRAMRLDQQIGRWYRVADDAGLPRPEKLASYRALAADYFETDRFAEFCQRHLAHADECMVTYIQSAEFDDLLVRTIRTAFPTHEHDKLVAHYRGLLAAWANEQRTGSP